MGSLIANLRARAHAPVDPRVVAVLRIGIALEVVLRFAMIFPWLPMWYGPHGVLTLAAAHRYSGEGPSLFWLMPDSLVTVWILWAIAIVAGFALLLGLHARLAAAVLFAVWVSFLERNQVIWDSGDTLLRIELFLAIFMPLGAVAALDAARGAPDRSSMSGVAVRLLRLQVCYAFLMAGLAKWRGGMWLDGTAMSKVMFNDDFFGNLWFPDALRYMPWVWALISWGTLVAEVVIPVAAWIPRTRRIAMIAGIVFHLGLLYTMNIAHFQLGMIVAWLSFLNWEEDVAPIIARVQGSRVALDAAS